MSDSAVLEQQETIPQKDSDFSEEELKRLRAHFSVWLTRIESPNSNFTQVGSYTVKRNEGEEGTEIAAFSYESPMWTGGWVLVATDKWGKVTGWRNTYFSKPENGGVGAAGNIDVFKRGQGIGSALEAINLKLLQEKVNNDPNLSRINYIADDANGRRLAELEEKLSEGAKKGENNQALEKEVEKARGERVAWEKLFGIGGKLGFDNESGKPVKDFVKGGSQGDLGLIIENNDKKVNLETAVREMVLGFK